MSSVFLSQNIPKSEVVHQRVIINEADYQEKIDPKQEPILPSGFIYFMVALGLLVVTIWATNQYVKKPTLIEPAQVYPKKKKPTK